MSTRWLKKRCRCALPTARPPLWQLRALVTQRRVVAMPGMDHRVVGEASEDLSLEVSHQCVEIGRVGRPAGATRKETVTGEKMGIRPAGIGQCDRAGRVSDKTDHLQELLAEFDPAAVPGARQPLDAGALGGGGD